MPTTVAADPSDQDLAKVIEATKRECSEGIAVIKKQVEALQKTVIENNNHLIRIIKLIDDIQQTIVIIERAASELNTRLTSAERKVDKTSNATAICNQNYTVIRNYTRQLAKQFNELKSEVATLRDDVDTQGARWLKLAIFSSAVVAVGGFVIWAVHEYIGWVHLFQVLGAE